jgi:uroporphyrinogen III methyltransferase/synthase
VPPSPGIVYLVGAGPGDPGLLTVRGRDLLEQCDAVVYDALANAALLDLARRAERHPVGKRGGCPESASQAGINALLVELAVAGKRVVRLKGGDPFVFGRGSEEAQALARSGIDFEVVPGVTAGIAAPAYAGIPVTHRGLSTAVTFVTGREDASKDVATMDWEALARAGGTIVLYMGLEALANYVEALIRGGRSPDTPAAVVEWGTYPRQRTLVGSLRSLVDRVRVEKFAAPVITIIGGVVSLRDEIAWFESRPLFARRIVITRARALATTLRDALAEAGAEVIELPATRIERLDLSRLRDALARPADYQWMVFTSQNTVEIVWDVLRSDDRDARGLAGVRLAAVGPATADALLARGLAVDVVADRFVAEGVLDAMRRRDDVRGARVLYASSLGARDVLRLGLESLGATVEWLPVYRSLPDGSGASDVRRELQNGRVDLVAFTSASAVHAFVGAVGESLALPVPVASIGPITSQAARQAGLTVAVEATESTISGLVSAIGHHYAAP